MKNKLKFIQQVLYRMKRRYGEPCDLIRRDTDVVDRETGKKTVTRSSIHIARILILPSTIHREFYYDLAFIASNKNFTYGGHVGTGERKFIFDRKDLGDWEIKNDQYFIYDGRRYDIKEIDEFEHRMAYIVIGKESLAVPLENLISVELEHSVNLDDEVEVVVE